MNEELIKQLKEKVKGLSREDRMMVLMAHLLIFTLTRKTRNVSLLRFETHNDSDIDVNGTSKQGVIYETFEKLLRVFGTPMGASDDGKVDVEWNIMFNDGVVATIYNWKNGPASMGSNGINPVDNKTWHIGGKTISAVYDVEEILKSFLIFEIFPKFLTSPKVTLVEFSVK